MISSKRDFMGHPTPPLPDPHELSYEPIHIFNEPALMTYRRIDKSKLPQGIYCYEAMHDDEDTGIITMIAKNIHINHWATILTKKPIVLQDGYRTIDEDKDIRFNEQNPVRLQEFLKKKRMRSLER